MEPAASQDCLVPTEAHKWKSAHSAEGRPSVLVTMVQMLKSDLIELGSLLMGSFSNSLFL